MRHAPKACKSRVFFAFGHVILRVYIPFCMTWVIRRWQEWVNDPSRLLHAQKENESNYHPDPSLHQTVFFFLCKNDPLGRCSFNWAFFNRVEQWKPTRFDQRPTTQGSGAGLSASKLEPGPDNHKRRLTRQMVVAPWSSWQGPGANHRSGSMSVGPSETVTGPGSGWLADPAIHSLLG